MGDAEDRGARPKGPHRGQHGDDRERYGPSTPCPIAHRDDRTDHRQSGSHNAEEQNRFECAREHRSVTIEHGAEGGAEELSHLQHIRGARKIVHRATGGEIGSRTRCEGCGDLRRDQRCAPHRGERQSPPQTTTGRIDEQTDAERRHHIADLNDDLRMPAGHHARCDGGGCGDTARRARSDLEESMYRPQHNRQPCEHQDLFELHRFRGDSAAQNSNRRCGGRGEG